MSKLRRITASCVFSIMIVSCGLAFTAPVGASGGYTPPSTVVICRTLSSAEAALACLPDGKLKTYLAAQIDAAQAKYNCL